MKTAQKKTLDSLLREIIAYRDNGKCQMCGKPGREVSHIYSKAPIHHQNMRWMPENTFYACHHCHFYKWHKEIIGSHDWYMKNIDEARRLELSAEAMKPSKQMFGGDYEKIREYLMEEFEKIKNCQSL